MLKELIPFKKHDKNLEKSANSPFQLLQSQINELFDTFFDDDSFGGWLDKKDDFGSFQNLSPSFEVKEDKKKITVRAELPGVSEKDIDVTLDNGLLTITGEKRLEKKDDDEHCHFTEFQYGSFSRSFNLSSEIDEDKVKAKFHKGVLNLELPKKSVKEKKSKSIKVEVG